MNPLKVIMIASEVANMSKQEIDFLASALVGLKNKDVAETLQFQINVKIQENLLKSEKEFI